MKKEFTHQPEDNPFILFLLLIFSFFLYYFWWIARMSNFFNEEPQTNILLILATLGLWGIFLNIRYLQKSEEINERQMQWYFILFLPISILIIQNNVNEYYFNKLT
jgi:uncharacterized membrane protein